MIIRSCKREDLWTCNDRFARARTLEIGRRLIDTINRISELQRSQNVVAMVKLGMPRPIYFLLPPSHEAPTSSRGWNRDDLDPARRFPQGRKDRFLPFSDNPDIFRRLGDVPRSRLCERRNAVPGTTASHARKVSFISKSLNETVLFGVCASWRRETNNIRSREKTGTMKTMLPY